MKLQGTRPTYWMANDLHSLAKDIANKNRMTLQELFELGTQLAIAKLQGTKYEEEQMSRIERRYVRQFLAIMRAPETKRVKEAREILPRLIDSFYEYING